MKQISINIFKAIAVLGLFAGLFSCNEDKGNYDYVTINTVDSINGINDVHRAASGDTLRIDPKVVLGEGKDKDDFLYTWYYRVGSDNVNDGRWEVLQEGFNLEVEVADPIGTPAKTYTLAFEMLNKTTNIAYRRVFKLSVESPYAKGFAALCELDNGFDIDMIALSPDNKFIPYKNILETTGSALPREGVKPYDILTYTDRLAPDPYAASGGYSLFILTDQYSTRLNPADYSWQSSYDVSNIVEVGSHLDKEYVKQDKPIVAQQMKVGYYGANPRLFMYHKEPDGQYNWYFYTTNMMSYLFSVQMNGVRATNPVERFEPSPHIAVVQGGFMTYDVNKKRFLYGALPDNNYTSANIFYAEPIPAEQDIYAFKYNDPNEGLLYMSAIADDSYYPRGYAIVKLADGSFKYIEFGSATTVGIMANNTNTKVRYSVIPAGSNIANAKFFARMPRPSNNSFLYYVTNDNKVMKVDVSSNTAAIEDITSSILTGDGYNEITLFEYTLPESNPLGDEAKRALAVGTYNSSLGKNEGGKLEFFLPASAATGNMVLAKYPAEPTEDEGYQIDMSWTGLGRIVGLSYKQQ